MPTPEIDLESFRRELLAWFKTHQRDLPWRRTRDPYAIWLSEVMLQQTRVAAALPFYQRFLDRFPDFQTLAAASEADLLAHWAGLGYYYRARNLQKAAQSMCAGNSFPSSYEAICALPGVGAYTSAAVASIAFHLPFAAVDGNVMRVLSRIYADPGDIKSVPSRKRFTILAQNLLSTEQPGAFNQAMMELGATICLPRNPQCLLCPVADQCRARAAGRQQEFPVKLGRAKPQEEHRTLLWIEDQGRLLAYQRPPDSKLMPGFWELPEPVHLPGVMPGALLAEFKHGITVHRYRLSLHTAHPPDDVRDCQWIDLDSLVSRPISTIFRKALRLISRHTPPVHQAAAVGGSISG